MSQSGGCGSGNMKKEHREQRAASQWGKSHVREGRNGS